MPDKQRNRSENIDISLSLLVQLFVHIAAYLVEDTHGIDSLQILLGTILGLPGSLSGSSHSLVTFKVLPQKPFRKIVRLTLLLHPPTNGSDPLFLLSMVQRHIL